MFFPAYAVYFFYFIRINKWFNQLLFFIHFWTSPFFFFRPFPPSNFVWLCPFLREYMTVSWWDLLDSFQSPIDLPHTSLISQSLSCSSSSSCSSCHHVIRIHSTSAEFFRIICQQCQETTRLIQRISRESMPGGQHGFQMRSDTQSREGREGSVFFLSSWYILCMEEILSPSIDVCCSCFCLSFFLFFHVSSDLSLSLCPQVSRVNMKVSRSYMSSTKIKG